MDMDNWYSKSIHQAISLQAKVTELEFLLAGHDLHMSYVIFNR